MDVWNYHELRKSYCWNMKYLMLMVYKNGGLYSKNAYNVTYIQVVISLVNWHFYPTSIMHINFQLKPSYENSKCPK